MIKNIFYRLTKYWVFWFVIIFSLVLVFGYSTYYYINSKTSDVKWEHNVLPYESILELEMQIESIKANISEMEYEAKYKSENEKIILEEQIVYAEETLAVLNYLHDNNISYASVAEDGALLYFERNCRGYSMQLLEIVYVFTLFVGILLVEQIVCAGKSNGAFVSNYIMYGRKRRI